MMMSANLVGFAVGLDGLKGLVQGIVGSYSGIISFIVLRSRSPKLTSDPGLVFLGVACTALFTGAQLMFELREEEIRHGIHMKC